MRPQLLPLAVQQAGGQRDGAGWQLCGGSSSQHGLAARGALAILLTATAQLCACACGTAGCWEAAQVCAECGRGSHQALTAAGHSRRCCKRRRHIRRQPAKGSSWGGCLHCELPLQANLLRLLRLLRLLSAIHLHLDGLPALHLLKLHSGIPLLLLCISRGPVRLLQAACSCFRSRSCHRHQAQ